MIKLNAGFSRKIGEPGFGSRGASVNVELEVESNLISDPDGLVNRIRGLFDLARRSVDEELRTDAPNAGTSPPARTNGRARAGTSNGAASQDTVRYATAAQVRAINTICDRQGIDALKMVRQRYRVTDIEELSLQEASSLIDELKAAPTNGRKGGGR